MTPSTQGRTRTGNLPSGRMPRRRATGELLRPSAAVSREQGRWELGESVLGRSVGRQNRNLEIVDLDRDHAICDWTPESAYQLPW